MLDKNNRTPLCLNTGLSIFSKYCKFDGKYAGYNYVQSSLIEDQVTQKQCLGIFLDEFFVGHTVRQTDKICRTFLKFGGFV